MQIYDMLNILLLFPPSCKGYVILLIKMMYLFLQFSTAWNVHFKYFTYRCEHIADCKKVYDEPCVHIYSDAMILLNIYINLHV